MSEPTSEQSVAQALGLPDVTMNFGVMTSPAMHALIAALATAQGAFEDVIKNKTATIRPRDPSKTAYSFMYADLQAIRGATQAALSANGIATVCLPVMVDDRRHLRLSLLHKEGGWMCGELPMPSVDGEGYLGEIVKALGGLMTYLRRYLLTNMLNLAADSDLDDNGEEPADIKPAAVQHPGMATAKNVGELSTIMRGLTKEDKAKYAEHFNRRQAELVRAEPREESAT